MQEDQLHTGNSTFINKDFVGEFVYGGIDGAITTFAVVAGAEGAGLDISVVIILGIANLIADGFSMSVGNYFSTKSEHDNFEKHKQIEYWEIEHLHDREVQEIREIYRLKGFQGELLEEVVQVITSNKDVWVDTMMKEELEMIKGNKSPYKTAGVTFISFIVVGAVPLLSYIFVDGGTITEQSNLFIYSCLLTAVALGIVGSLKSKVTETNVAKGIVETLLLGGIAAFFAYFVGDLLELLLL